MGHFGELEELDGVRMPWNIWPSSRVEALKCVIPFSALYTPNKPLQHLQVMDYEPVPCKNCGGILNPFASCDFTAHLWICPLCFGRNHFPAQYNGINEQMLPAELFQEYTTIEYRLPALKPVYAPAYVFVVDTCLSEEELNASQGAISQALQMIPEYARVALVTFGTHVQVYELGFDVLNKSYVFQGSKEYTAQQVQSQLGIGPSTASRQPASPSRPGMKAQQQDPIAFAARRFILPVSECEFTISAAIEGLRKDAFPSVADHRPSRCTGTAIQVAAGMMAGCLPAGSCAARIMLFAGGPPTVGSGKVVDMELVQPIRSHKDLMKEAAPHYKKARKFYDGLAAQLVQQGHALDVFACSLDQVGLAEMQTAVEQTGGLLVQASTFNAQAFKESFRRIFAPPTEEGHLGMNSNAQFEVVCSRDVKVAGLLGSAASLEAKSSAVAEQQVGLGGTTKWRLASLDQSTTVGVFFEIMTSKKQESAGLADGAAGQTFFIQFITKYLNGQTGRTHCRVSTITRQWVEGGNLATLIAGFDQEAAAVIVARLATHKMEAEEDFDATRWLDRTLIRVASRFGDYRKDDPTSFNLQPQLEYLPQFMFNLRRSQFVQVFGNSPDETAYCRVLLNRETTSDAITMIQPALQAYSMGGVQAEPVMLDVASVTPDRVLLLDSYFTVVVWHGSTVAQWRKADYHLQEEYAHLKPLMEEPLQEADSIIKKRFPIPHFVNCDQNGSQARFLLAKLNPSSTHNNQSGMSAEVIMTDDVSLQVFTDHLKKLAVQS
ncbi:TPA: hypothetical protein ACH3X2_014085 [Trebouxia sp. C0005]